VVALYGLLIWNFARDHLVSNLQHSVRYEKAIMPAGKPAHFHDLLLSIDALSREDLRTLNQYIVDRCKLLNDDSRAKVMKQFNPGDKANFRR